MARVAPGSCAVMAAVLSLVAQGCAGAARYQEVHVQQGGARRSLEPAEVMQRSAPSIAVIHTDIGRGMGFVVDPDGYVLTNRHVIEDADHIDHVTFPGARPPLRFESVNVIYIDPVRDLALVKIETDRPLPALRLATRRSRATADYVAMSDPVLLMQRAEQRSDDDLVARLGTVTTLEAYNSLAGPGAFVGVSTDVREGQSGGPVLDRFGRAIGVVTWTWRNRQGGYAIPIADAHHMLAERPDLRNEARQKDRARQRASEFVRAVEGRRFDQARRITSPTYAKRVREQSIVAILGNGSGPAAAIQGFVAGLEALAIERNVESDAELAELLQEVVFRTGTPEFRQALGVEGVLEPEQVISFFFEFGQGYVAARYYGDRSPPEAVEAGIRRLQTVDAARTFALAKLTMLLGKENAELESVQLVPGAYGPTAIATLRTHQPETRRDRGGSEMSSGTVQADSVNGRVIMLRLRLEWGDWYVSDVLPQSHVTVDAAKSTRRG